jgi:hypothetical protein
MVFLGRTSMRCCGKKQALPLSSMDMPVLLVDARLTALQALLDVDAMTEAALIRHVADQ